jgi:hypothetical protein
MLYEFCPELLVKLLSSYSTYVYDVNTGLFIYDLGDKKLVCFLYGYRYKHEKLENSMETHTVYLEMFNMCSISYSAHVKAIFEFFPHMPQLH